MPRPTNVYVSPTALLHNLNTIQKKAPQAQIIAMVKANAYGCGIKNIIPHLHGKVSYLGVACIEEALAIRALGIQTPCLIVQGVFEPDEWHFSTTHAVEYVIHQSKQVDWLLEKPLKKIITVWIKVNTGMNRLGFLPEALPVIIKKLQACAWINPDLRLMTHFANAEQHHPLNTIQMTTFQQIITAYPHFKTSMANSAAIFQHPHTHAHFIRPGISLYGISPLPHTCGQDLNLQPVIQVISKIIEIYTITVGSTVGYGSTWTAQRTTRVGVVPIGYGDGYPRHIQPGTSVWIKGDDIPIIGTISMDTLTLDLTDFQHIQVHDRVELWGKHLPIETIAKAAGTIPYELLCQMTQRTFL